MMAFPGGQWFSDWVAGVPADEARRRYMLGGLQPAPKPRIVKHRGAGTKAWVCFTKEPAVDTVPGVGMSPKSAYDDWCWWLQNGPQ